MMMMIIITSNKVYGSVDIKYQCAKVCLPENFLDINECSTNSHICDVNAVCSNVQGSYTCACKSGYSGDGKTCTGKLLRFSVCMLHYKEISH